VVILEIYLFGTTEPKLETSELYNKHATVIPPLALPRPPHGVRRAQLILVSYSERIFEAIHDLVSWDADCCIHGAPCGRGRLRHPLSTVAPRRVGSPTSMLAWYINQLSRLGG
jgi:hypothetical protein